MTWRVGRFTRVHIVLSIATSALLCSIGAVYFQETASPSCERADQKPKIPTSQKVAFPNLELAPMRLVESDLDLIVPFCASTFLMRPGAMVPSRALCLRDPEAKDERDVTEGEPIYLEQKKGRLFFAPLGEKRSLWALPERLGDSVSLEIYANIQGNNKRIKQVKIPFEDAKPWPVNGIASNDLLIDAHLFERLGLRWHGKNTLDPDRGELLVFERAGRVCYAKKGEWFSLSDVGFGPIKQRVSKYEPVIQLKEIKEQGLEFEVVDADAQCALRLLIKATPEVLSDSCIDQLSFLGHRQIDSVSLQSAGVKKSFAASIGSLIFFSGDEWSSCESPGPALRIERIEKKDRKNRLVATLFSRGRSQQRPVVLVQAIAKEKPQ